ncbi:hypothetical protein AUG86_05090 [Euryarchaeota archaeon 13_1_20CM_4_64_14]|nr:MAG: hypothetical protein AUG86_05090 [Euryarchaeota archaeon 13_1_20CM_4_64_14]
MLGAGAAPGHRALVDARDGRASDAVEEALARIALRDTADDEVHQEQEPIDLRNVSDEAVHDVQVAVDRDDAETEEPLPDRRAEQGLEEHRVEEPDDAVQERGHVPRQRHEGQREREQQINHSDDDCIDERSEEPADPVLLQGRIMSNQVNGRRHDSPIRTRRYPTGLHKSIGRILGE